MIVNFNFKYETDGMKELLAITTKEKLLKELLKSVEEEFTKDYLKRIEEYANE